MKRIYRALYVFFWKKLCLRPDADPQWFIWRWNTLTGRIAGYFHRRSCDTCLGRAKNEVKP